MKYLTLTEISRELENRDVRVTLKEAKLAGLLPKSQRIARKSGGVGSEPAYDEKIIDYLAIIGGLKEEGYPLSVIRTKLAKLIKENSDLEMKRKNVKEILKEAINAGTGDRRVTLVAKALTEVEDIEIDEFSLLEKELEQFDNPESRLRYLLGKNLPERLKKWQR